MDGGEIRVGGAPHLVEKERQELPETAVQGGPGELPGQGMEEPPDLPRVPEAEGGKDPAEDRGRGELFEGEDLEESHVEEAIITFLFPQVRTRNILAPP
jgi:hypothetical protein